MNDLKFSEEELVTILTALRMVEYEDADKIVDKIVNYLKAKEEQND